MTTRLCACGCGRPISQPGRPRQFFSMSCRSRAMNASMTTAQKHDRAMKAGAVATAKRLARERQQARSATSRLL